LTRRLIVNADDFGLTPGINAGVLDAHTRGILTSASLFANAAATDDAIAIARRTATLAVGCHLTLVDGSPVLPPSNLPTLAPAGRFRPTWTSFVFDLLSRRIRLQEVELELSAQLRRLTGAGLRLTHLDSHKHVHAYPRVFAIVARLAQRFGIRTVRIPCEPPPLSLLRRHAFGIGSRQAAENLALAPWAARDRRLLEAHGLPPAPHFFGRVLTGLFTPATFHALIRLLPQGTSELMVHPGYPDAALAPARRGSRVVDRSVYARAGEGCGAETDTT
jgi:hopanoid biosynthesis associated protein HpnK